MSDECRGENIESVLSIPAFAGIMVTNASAVTPALVLAPFDKWAAVVVDAAREKVTNDFYALGWASTHELFFKKAVSPGLKN